MQTTRRKSCGCSKPSPICTVTSKISICLSFHFKPAEHEEKILISYLIAGYHSGDKGVGPSVLVHVGCVHLL